MGLMRVQCWRLREMRQPDGSRPKDQPRLFSVRDLFVMFLQQVFAEITFKVTPHRMDMVRVVLSVVILHEEGRALDAIIVRFAKFESASPGEQNLFVTGN